jgi:hypothetical protein
MPQLLGSHQRSPFSALPSATRIQRHCFVFFETFDSPVCTTLTSPTAHCPDLDCLPPICRISYRHWNIAPIVLGYLHSVIPGCLETLGKVKRTSGRTPRRSGHHIHWHYMGLPGIGDSACSNGDPSGVLSYSPARSWTPVRIRSQPWATSYAQP